ncbi:MAG: radical SAM protein [Candidatus Omnitrophota bacterium]|jgi:MoaA/NifB/PqqE/SkfB family radical SAM enzyme
MKKSSIIPIAKNLLRAQILKRNIPIIVSWAITYECNSRCQYCENWTYPHDNELSYKEITAIIDDLATMGTAAISLTGGEPLLRPDLGDILDHAVRGKIYVSVNTNGVLAQTHIPVLKKADRVTLSFDGPKAVHDAIRGAGSHDLVLRAIESLLRNGCVPTLNTVLTKLSAPDVDYVLRIARQYNLKVAFQPVSLYLLESKKENPLAPIPEDYRAAIGKIIIAKKRGNQHILNSLAGLEHLARWPQPTAIACSAGRVHFRIEPDGLMTNCSRQFLMKSKQSQSADIRQEGIRNAVARLTVIPCRDCWCASTVEMNLATSFNFSGVINMLKRTCLS